MRILLPFGKNGIPLEIEDAKIPDLLEKMIPSVARHLGTLKDLGVDLTPAIGRMLGAQPSTPIAPTAPASTPAEPTEAEMQKAGYWKHTDGRWYPGDLGAKLATKVAEPVLRVCGTCVRGNIATNQPLAPFNPPCSTCQFDAARASYMTKP